MSDHDHDEYEWTPEPDVPILMAWHATHSMGSYRDRPTIRLWFPDEAPYAIVQTVSRGCQSVYLPDPEKPMVDVHLGGGIQVGGYLSDMETYFAAALEALKLARWQADNLAAQTRAEEAVIGGAG